MGVPCISEAHHLINVNLGDTTCDILVINILSSFNPSFHIDLVAFKIISFFIGNILSEESEGDEVMPFGLFHPVTVTVAVAFIGSEGDRHFFISIFKSKDFRVFTKVSNKNNFIKTCHE